MADLKAMDSNKVVFSGIVIWKEESQSTTAITMRVTTRPEGRVRRYTNYPRLFAFDQEVREKLSQISTGSRVVAEGYVTSTKIQRDENGSIVPSNKPLQSFVVTDIRIATAEDEEENGIEIVGAVERAYVTRSGVVNFIVVSFRDDHYLKRIKISAFPKKDVNYMEFMPQGTRVRIKSHCSTVMEDAQKGRVTREFLIADSIEKA